MENNRDVVIVSAVRTPFGRFDGVAREIPSIDLGVAVVKESLNRIGLDPGEVDELYYGTCIPAEYAPYLNVPARQITLLAGFPAESISMTIDRACCSSMTALRLGCRAIRSGEADVVVGCGAENMGNACLLVDAKYARWGNRLGHVQMEDILFELGYGKKGFNPVALDAGEVALEYDVSREDQDRWGLRSQEQWARAYGEDKFKIGEEIMPLEIPQRKGDPIILDRDEPPRETSLEKLAKLRAIYGSPTVTAGNAPGMNAGGSAIVIMSREKALEKGLKPLATIDAMEWAAGEPRDMATLPAKAIEKVLARVDKGIEDMDLIEINEAFAAVTLVSLKILADMDQEKWKALQEKSNVNGGAIAIGHPVGASGARITMTLMYELMRRGGGQGVAAICGGLGQGESLVLSV
ncbi:MAG: thiolase family protein [Deltaproteobacteria bacterium]|nr:thiolase family protein [Deltaproteobacteria bacterium]